MSRAFGVDVSTWQGQMDWAITKQAGAKFAFIRAGSCTSSGGTPYTDYRFEENALDAPQYIPVGFYWYFRPNHDPTAQADYFCDLIQDKEWLLPPVLDLEENGGLSPAQVTAACKEFIGRVYARVEVWVLVYSRGYFLHDNTVDDPIWAECDIYIARYTQKPEPWGNPNDSAKLDPPYWDTWVFWQYAVNTDAAVKYGGEGPPGGDDDIDYNYFNGDEEALWEYIGEAPPSLPETIGVKVNIEVDGQDVKYQGHIGLKL